MAVQMVDPMGKMWAEWLVGRLDLMKAVKLAGWLVALRVGHSD